MSTLKLTWPDALDAYEIHLQARRLSPRTIDGHHRDIEHLRYCLAPLRPDQVRVADLRGYQVGLLTGETSRTGRPLTAGSVARVSSTLRRFFAFLAAEGVIKSDPAQRLERPKLPHRPVEEGLDGRSGLAGARGRG